MERVLASNEALLAISSGWGPRRPFYPGSLVHQVEGEVLEINMESPVAKRIHMEIESQQFDADLSESSDVYDADDEKDGSSPINADDEDDGSSFIELSSHHADHGDIDEESHIDYDEFEDHVAPDHQFEDNVHRRFRDSLERGSQYLERWGSYLERSYIERWFHEHPVAPDDQFEDNVLQDNFHRAFQNLERAFQDLERSYPERLFQDLRSRFYHLRYSFINPISLQSHYFYLHHRNRLERLFQDLERMLQDHRERMLQDHRERMLQDHRERMLQGRRERGHIDLERMLQDHRQRDFQDHAEHRTLHSRSIDTHATDGTRDFVFLSHHRWDLRDGDLEQVLRAFQDLEHSWFDIEPLGASINSMLQWLRGKGRFHRAEKLRRTLRAEHHLLGDFDLNNVAELFGSFERMIAAMKEKSSNFIGINIFVHGYNTDFESALARTAKMGKSMEYDYINVAFAWPAANDASLFDLVKDFRKEFPDEPMNLLGHSMGCCIVLHAFSHLLHQRFPLNSVIFAAADVDRLELKEQMRMLDSEVKGLPRKPLIVRSDNCEMHRTSLHSTEQRSKFEIRASNR